MWIEIPASKAFAPDVQLTGADGSIVYFEASENMQHIILNFTAAASRCGVVFQFTTPLLLYSPAIMEDQVVHYDLAAFKPERLYLPLPNGLIGIGKDLYIIKHNEYMNIACCIDKIGSTIRFEIENPSQQDFHWRLTVFCGPLQQAIDLAQAINITPVVFL